MKDKDTELLKLINICHSNLKNSKECLDYLRDRNVSDEYIEKYKIGYFPQNVTKLKSFVSENVMEKLAIVDYSGQSKFANCFYLIFPLLSEYQEPIGIGGRTLMSDLHRGLYNKPKYENSSFKKAKYFYGLNHSRTAIIAKQDVYIVEGYFDQISLDANGIDNSVAICGTAFSNTHFLKLIRYTNKLTFILDQDDGGRKAMEKIYSKYSNKGVKLRFKVLPAGYKDVDEYFSSGKNKSDFYREIEEFVPAW